MFDRQNSSDIDNLEDVKDILKMMMKQETGFYKRRDYLAVDSCLLQKVVDPTWRQRITEWMYSVVDHCSLRRDSVAVASYYLDMSVDKGVINSRQEFQLAAMTSLQLAVKLYDSSVVKLESLVKLGRGLFTEHDIIDMEARILKALDWQVHPPTAVCFLRQYLRLLPTTVSPVVRYMIAEVTRFISEISVCLYTFIKYPPSAVAYAGLVIAVGRIDEEVLSICQRQEIINTISNTAGLSMISTQMSAIIEELNASLEKNTSLQDLIRTIDIQCHSHLQKSRLSETNLLEVCQSMRSPRDVTEPRIYCR